MPYDHKTQKVQMNNGRPDVQREDFGLFGGPSFYYKAMLVHVTNYQEMPHDSIFEYVWNPCLEARPQHITEQYGEASREHVSVVVTPPGYKPGHVVHRSQYALTELGMLETEVRIKSEELNNDADGGVDVAM